MKSNQEFIGFLEKEISNMIGLPDTCESRDYLAVNIASVVKSYMNMFPLPYSRSINTSNVQNHIMVLGDRSSGSLTVVFSEELKHLLNGEVPVMLGNGVTPTWDTDYTTGFGT